jgi:hypothetical protein
MYNSKNYRINISQTLNIIQITLQIQIPLNILTLHKQTDGKSHFHYINEKTYYEVSLKHNCLIKINHES